jgi:phage head maturation protease
MSDHAFEGFRVVPCGRSVRGIRAGDPVVLVPVETTLADVRLLGLPTVRRVARYGLRDVVLVPVEEWRESFPAAAVPT